MATDVKQNGINSVIGKCVAPGQYRITGSYGIEGYKHSNKIEIQSQP